MNWICAGGSCGLIFPSPLLHALALGQITTQQPSVGTRVNGGRQGQGHADSVLYPQPLMDNLESQTYEVFEKDPIKYSQYQQVGVACKEGAG